MCAGYERNHSTMCVGYSKCYAQRTVLWASALTSPSHYYAKWTVLLASPSQYYAKWTVLFATAKHYGKSEKRTFNIKFDPLLHIAQR